MTSHKRVNKPIPPAAPCETDGCEEPRAQGERLCHTCLLDAKLGTSVGKARVEERKRKRPE